MCFIELKQPKVSNLQKTGWKIEACCDANWANDKVDWHLFSRYIIVLPVAVILWNFKNQHLTVLTEAEYLAKCHTAKEVLWFKTFLQIILNKRFLISPQKVLYDNQGFNTRELNHVTSVNNKNILI